MSFAAACVRVTRWWWIRHAPVINPEGRVYGQRDIPPDLADRPALGRLAAVLPDRPCWLATPLSRTCQTLEALWQARGDGPVSDGNPEQCSYAREPAFLEQHFGAWQGLDHAQIQAATPAVAVRFWRAPAAMRAPEGESFLDVVARVAEGVGRWSEAALDPATNPARDIVAVAHGGSIRAALCLALGLDPEKALAFQIDTISLTRIDHLAVAGQPALWRVCAVNLPPGSRPGAPVLR